MGFGLELRSDLTQGKPIIRVPRSAIMNVASAINPSLDYGRAIQQLMIEADIGDVGAVSLHLLSERKKGPASQWSAYINTLPTVYNTLEWWSTEQLELLMGTAAYDYYIQSSQTKYRRFQATMIHAKGRYPHLFNTFDEDELLWAFTSVSSRAFLLSHQGPFSSNATAALGGALQSCTLVPLIDLVNHASGLLAPAANKHGHVVIKAPADMRTGETAWISYHCGAACHYCDANWLVDFGFFPSMGLSNLPEPPDCVNLGLKFDWNQLEAWKREILGEAPEYPHVLLPNAMPDATTVQVLRALTVRSPDMLLPEGVEFGSSDEDLHAVGLLKGAIESKLANLQHFSIADDNKALENSIEAKMEHIESVALQYRVREKRLLEACLSRLNAIRKRLKLF